MPQRALLALGFVGLVLLIYYGLGAIVAYTDDAYVQSDFVAVAPEVAGPVRTVHVRDDQPVKAGDPLAEIDPRPSISRSPSGRPGSPRRGRSRRPSRPRPLR